MTTAKKPPRPTESMLYKLYMQSPPFVQNAAISLLGARNRVFRYGSRFRAQVSFLAESERWSEEKVLRWQDQELAILLAHSFSTVPHYSDLSRRRGLQLSAPRGTLSELPFLEKATIREDPSRFISSVFSGSRTLRVMTSGTTGSPMTFAIDPESRQMHFAFFDRLLRWAGLNRDAWHGVFMGRILGTESQLRRRPWRVDFSNCRVYYSSYHIRKETINTYTNHLLRRDHEWIEGYPSAMGNLARLGLAEGLEFPRLKAVIPSSETMDDPTRRVLEEAFGKVIWEFYAAAEQAAFISQCEAGSLHVNPEYGIVEFEPQGLNQDGEALYELIATSFMNRATPLIRYRTDDLVVRDTSPCPCGRAFPRIKRIMGRTSQAVVLPDGRRVTGISNVPKGLPIAQSQLVQVSDSAFEFRVVPVGSQWDRSDEETVEKRLRDRLGDSVKVTIHIVSRIRPGPNGKTPLVRALRPSSTDTSER